jgi:alkaline phosphatase
MKGQPMLRIFVNAHLQNDYPIKNARGVSSQGGEKKVTFWGCFCLCVICLFYGCIGADTDEEELFSSPKERCSDNQKMFKLILKTDNYGYETSFKLVNTGTGRKVVGGPPKDTNYARNTLYAGQRCLPQGAYELTFYDKQGDGICCQYSEGFYQVFLGGELIQEGGSFEAEETITFAVTSSHLETNDTVTPRNLIVMVPDGMGISNVTAARIYKNGLSGEPLTFETLDRIGYQRTHSANSTVTDSAAGAAAWANGKKYNNGEISCHDNDGDHICDDEPGDTVLEVAQNLGLSTGLVATSTVTHATPAVWASHVHSRYCESTIFEQFLAHNVDVILGGGIGLNRNGRGCSPDTTNESYILDLVNQAQSNHDYTYVMTEEELNAATENAVRLLGLFSEDGVTSSMTPMYLRNEQTAEPTLAEMTASALTHLERNEKGFFLLVEGSQVDWGNHANNYMYQINELLAFDDAVNVVLNWSDSDSSRQDNTLLIVVADHDTGGFAINGPYGSLSQSGDTNVQLLDNDNNPVFDNDGNPVMLADIVGAWTTGSHTGTDTLIWSKGPYSERLGLALDNTDLFYVMNDFLNNQ